MIKILQFTSYLLTYYLRSVSSHLVKYYHIKIAFVQMKKKKRKKSVCLVTIAIYFQLVALFALFAVAFAQAPKPVQPDQEQPVEGEALRDKRGLLLASYTAPAALAPAPIAYSSYVAPAAPISYALPYAYRAYPSYTYLG